VPSHQLVSPEAGPIRLAELGAQLTAPAVPPVWPRPADGEAKTESDVLVAFRCHARAAVFVNTVPTRGPKD
jgi:hypothetical protein